MSSLEQPVAVDYYKILGVPKNAHTKLICAHYRALALANHPALQHQNPNEAYRRFAEVAQAFDVLYDPEKRNIYDRYGERKLKEGLLQDGNLVGRYKFITDPEEVFQKFFGTKNVFEHLLEAGSKGDSHPIFKAQYPEINDGYQVPHLLVEVPCTLTEIFNGCTKEVTYPKQVLTSDGKGVQIVQETKTIVVSPGESSLVPLVYPGQGHTHPGFPPSLLMFSFVQIPQKNYRREMNDLIYTAQITLMDALDSKSITVKELSGELLELHFDQVISPQTTRIIENKGMPVKGFPELRGDLIVKFNIIFPQEIELEKKKRIVQLLKE